MARNKRTQYVRYNTTREGGLSPQNLSTSFGGEFKQVRGRNYTGYQRASGVGPVYTGAGSGH